MADYLPSGDAELLAFANNFYAVVSAGSAADYGLTDALMASFQMKLAAYATSYQTAFNPDTRTKPAITARNNDKKLLATAARKLVKLAQAAPVMNDTKREQLKITVKKARRPIPAPTQRPAIDVVGVVGRTVTVNFYDPASATKRAKPAGCIAAKVYTFSGSSYPSDPSLWVYYGDFSKTLKCQIVFPDTAANGQQVWVTAAWTTQKGLVGPPAIAVTTNLQGGGVQPSAGLKLAA